MKVLSIGLGPQYLCNRAFCVDKDLDNDDGVGDDENDSSGGGSVTGVM